VDVNRPVNDAQREYFDRAQRVLAGGSLGNIYDDIILCEGNGARVRDVAGNEYIDYLLGSGPMLVGHRHPEVTEAVQKQIQKGATFFATNDQSIALAERIVDACPCAEKVRFMVSGSEATAYAMRAVRAFRRRDLMLKFEGGFHGMHDYALMSWAPARPPDFPRAVPDSAGIPECVAGQVLIAPFNDIQTTTELIRSHHDSLAGVIVEPMQRLIPPQPGFLAGLRELTEKYSVPLIFDEIVTGFRVAYGGAQEYYGVTPDLCTLSKALSGGYPLSAVAGRADIMAGFSPESKNGGGFMPQLTTFGGNPVSSAASLAVLDILRRPGTYNRLFETGRKLMQALEKLFGDAAIPAQIVGEPPVFDVFFTDVPITNYRSSLAADAGKLNRFRQLLLERGVYRGDSKMYISIAHTDADVAETIEVFKDAIDQLR
jgi:glutamate-1-semialdehyde 2,1-aminomutase